MAVYTPPPLHTEALREGLYKEIAAHVSGLRTVALVGLASRPGTGFFNSLLDGHPEIISIPHFRSETWDYVLDYKPPKSVVEEFIERNTKYFFSSLNSEERWEELGENKDTSVEIDLASFRLHMEGMLSYIGSEEHSVFVAAHVAYSIATGVDPLKGKVLFYHAHTPSALMAVSEILSLDEIVVMVRNPVNGIARMHEAVDAEKHESLSQFRQACSHLFNDIDSIPTGREKFRILAFETLHEEPRLTLATICKDWGIDFSETLMRSTYWGLQWWGDTGSQNYLKNFNPSPRLSVFQNSLSAIDALTLECLLWPRISKYGIWREDGRRSQPTILELLAYRFLTLLPLRPERRVLLDNLRVLDFKGFQENFSHFRSRAKQLLKTHYAVNQETYVWPTVWGGTEPDLVGKQSSEVARLRDAGPPDEDRLALT